MVSSGWPRATLHHLRCVQYLKSWKRGKLLRIKCSLCVLGKTEATFRSAASMVQVTSAKISLGSRPGRRMLTNSHSKVSVWIITWWLAQRSSTSASSIRALLSPMYQTSYSRCWSCTSTGSAHWTPPGIIARVKESGMTTRTLYASHMMSGSSRTDPNAILWATLYWISMLLLLRGSPLSWSGTPVSTYSDTKTISTAWLWRSFPVQMRS